MNIKGIFFVFILLLSVITPSFGISWQTTSPDQKYVVIAGTDDHGLFRYQVFYDGKNIITPSTPGLLMEDGTVVGRHITFTFPMKPNNGLAMIIEPDI